MLFLVLFNITLKILVYSVQELIDLPDLRSGRIFDISYPFFYSLSKGLTLIDCFLCLKIQPKEQYFADFNELFMS